MKHNTAFTLSEKIQSNVQTFGEYQAAKLLAKKVQFQAYYFARFNRYPATIKGA